MVVASPGGHHQGDPLLDWEHGDPLTPACPWSLGQAGGALRCGELPRLSESSVRVLVPLATQAPTTRQGLLD